MITDPSAFDSLSEPGNTIKRSMNSESCDHEMCVVLTVTLRQPATRPNAEYSLHCVIEHSPVRLCCHPSFVLSPGFSPLNNSNVHY